jgi:hypothetical protein
MFGTQTDPGVCRDWRRHATGYDSRRVHFVDYFLAEASEPPTIFSHVPLGMRIQASF